MGKYQMRNNTIDLTKCPLCNKPFYEGQPVVIDQFDDDIMSYIFCKDCWNKIFISSKKNISNKKETKSNSKNTIKKEEKLWRYMDLSKFISLLMKKSLHLSSPELFNDKYEGAIGNLKNKDMWEDFYISNFRASMFTAPDNCWHNNSSENVEMNLQSLMKSFENLRIPAYILCWHRNDVESEAMWNMYAKNVENAIAIQTTCEKLRAQLPEDVKIEKVKYIDFKNRFASINNPYMYKRKSFEYEREIRVIKLDYNGTQKDYLDIPINLESMIEAVYVSPYAPSWFADIVKDLVNRYGFSFEVRQSEMNDECFR